MIKSGKSQDKEKPVVAFLQPFCGFQHILEGPEVNCGDFECDLDQPDPTLLDLKTYLDEDEIGVLPERQRLFYMGYEITDDNLKINDIVGSFGTNNFSLILTKAKESPIKLPNQRFLITG